MEGVADGLEVIRDGKRPQVVMRDPRKLQKSRLAHKRGRDYMPPERAAYRSAGFEFGGRSQHTAPDITELPPPGEATADLEILPAWHDEQHFEDENNWYGSYGADPELFHGHVC